MSNKIITASPTIWNTSPYKVSVYPDEAEGNHKEKNEKIKAKLDDLVEEIPEDHT